MSHTGNSFPVEGLKVVLNIDQEEYVMQLGKEAGARAVVHSQDKMPFPEDEGILAKPGYMTSIGISQVGFQIVVQSNLILPWNRSLGLDPEEGRAIHKMLFHG